MDLATVLLLQKSSFIVGPEETAFAKADEVRRAVKALVFSAGAAVISPSVSVGVALLRGAGDLQKLRDRADQALYLAKRGGRDRVELYADPQAVTERPASADSSADGARGVDPWRKDVQHERSRVA